MIFIIDLGWRNAKSSALYLCLKYEEILPTIERAITYFFRTHGKLLFFIETVTVALTFDKRQYDTNLSKLY